MLVQLIYRDQRQSLSKNSLVIIPAGDVVILIQGSNITQVRLDGRLRVGNSTTDGIIIPIDLNRSTGFHHLHIPPDDDFWFGTEDVKLKLDGIVEMLKYLRTKSLSWSGQLLFSDGSIYRDREVVYGWLDQHADSIINASAAIAAKPEQSTITESSITNKGGKRVDLKATMALLRRRGNELLESMDGGPLSIEGKTYFPHKVVVTKQGKTIDTLANRRTLWLLYKTRELILEVVSSPDIPDEEKRRCYSWINSIDRIANLTVLTRLFYHAVQGTPPSVRSLIETTDERYFTIYERAVDYSLLYGWTASKERRPLYSYVQYSDQIYQEFVAHVVAQALSLSPQAVTSPLKQPAFIGTDWDLYYNVIPPSKLVRSWRSFTSEPGDFRPDILLFKKSEQAGNPKVVICDAKYRNDKGRASESSRKELLSYMAAYGVNKCVVFYPPNPPEELGIYKVAAKDREIIEVTISPVPNLPDFIKLELPLVLDSARVTPPWSD